ncbi:MAG: fasciclin domain-containing protein [Rhodothermales bacterium]|nr:fasciclin domain-containing protein [Rhodothermales bacterium]
MQRLLTIQLTAVLSLTLLVACGSRDEAANETDASAATHGQAGVTDNVSDPNILQVALQSPDHTTLVAAVQAAELENVLVNAGPLTVFAPTNAAFDKLPPGTVDDLLEPANKEKLAQIITFHAAPGTYAGDGLKNGMKLYQATGHYIDVKVTDEGTFVHGVKILGTVDATNGVVHVVDEVLLPPEG